MGDTRRTSSRRHPMYTCGATTLAILWNLYKRALQINGPFGSVSRRLAKLGSRATPLLCVVQYQWLSLLWFIDEYLLLIETLIEKWVPLSRHVFDKIDCVVNKVDHVPRKFENFVNELPLLIHKFPVFELVASVLVIWGLNTAKEKEIGVDTSCNQQDNESEMTRNEGSTVVMPTTMKCSYKEALEKGVKEGEKDEGIENDIEEYIVEKGKSVVQNENENEMGDDPLLDLFDFGWVTPKANLAMARSASYT